MKYRVHVKEIHVRTYTVEAKSRAHAKTLVEQARATGHPDVRADPGPARPWGVLGPESWDVD